MTTSKVRRLDQDDLDDAYEKIRARTVQIGTCALLTKGRKQSTKKNILKIVEAALVPAEHDISVRCADGKNHRAHIVIYEKFYGEVPRGSYVIRTCDTPGCIAYKHLALMTAYQREVIRKGQQLTNLKLTEEVREEMKRRVREEGLTDGDIVKIYDSTLSFRKTAMEFGCSLSTVVRIRNGQSHANVTGHVVETKPGKGADKRIKLTDEQVLAIRNDGRPARTIAPEYGVSHVTVSRIRNMLQRDNARYGADK